MSKKALALGFIFILLSWLAAQAGVVPVAGIIAAGLAPDMFLLGLFFIAIWMVAKLLSNRTGSTLLAITIVVVLGLNSRLPSLISDSLSFSSNSLRLVDVLHGSVGQPIRLVSQASEINARRLPYASVIPACYGDSCFVTKGFRSPSPQLGSDYWYENFQGAVLAHGFSLAKPDEDAPTLIVETAVQGHFRTVHIKLADTNGKMLSQYNGQYRNGFPYEAEDGIHSDGPGSQFLLFEYLFHGNVLNRVANQIVPNGRANPLSEFLQNAARLTHPQGTTLGLSSGGVGSSVGASSTAVLIDVLEEKTYDPIWIIKEDKSQARSEWSRLSWDAERYARCKILLKPELADTPQLQTWYLFANDQTGRKKVRFTGDALCDLDVIWFFDYASEKDRLVLTKYSMIGDLIYRASFEKPKAPWGYEGSILLPSFRTENGYVNFEWWNSNQSGYERHVKRTLKIRFREPTP